MSQYLPPLIAVTAAGLGGIFLPVLYATKLVGECAAFGVESPTLGQAIQVVATAPDGSAAVDVDRLLTECRSRMPAYMVPAGVHGLAGPLPRNPNGKIDRKKLATEWVEQQQAGQPA